jgi:hypothetical protein
MENNSKETTGKDAFNQSGTSPTITEFLGAFFPDENESIHLRSFKPRTAPASPTLHSRMYETSPRRLRTDRQLQETLKANNVTQGLYFVVNSGGNEDKNIQRYNGFFVENDTLPIEEQHAKLTAAPIQPSIRVETLKSVHAYWLCDGDCNEVEWRAIQEGLIKYFDGDTKIKNPSRVMRIPHFNHVKYDNESGRYCYKPVKVVEFSPQRRYTVDDMESAFLKQQKVHPEDTAPPLGEFDESKGNADLKRLITLRGKLNKRGNYEMKCPSHNGQSSTSLVMLPNGAFRCMKEPRCTTQEIRDAFWLQENSTGQTSSNSYIRSGCHEKNPRSYPLLNNKAFHGLAGEIVNGISERSESHPAALLAQLLVAFGNMVGSEPYFMTEADKQRTNLFAVIVGESARAGRKGTAWGHIQRLLSGLDEEWGNTCLQHGGLSSGEGLITRLRDANGEDAGVKDKRLLVVETEFASVMRVKSREGNTLQDILRNAWDGKSLSVMRSKLSDSTKSTHPHLSLIGHTTRAEVRPLLSDVDAYDGYANRFLWCCSKRTKKLPRGGKLHEQDMASFLRRLRKAIDFASSCGELDFDSEADALWSDIYNSINDEEQGPVAAMLARAEPQMIRLAMVYALLDGCDTVSRVHLEAARAVWDYSEASVRYLFGGLKPLTRRAQKCNPPLFRTTHK